MISLEDPRWLNLTGGYGTSFDPRPLLRRLESETNPADVWQELWEELYHQGDVGDASFAAVPFLVRTYKYQSAPHWNTYAIVAVVELARKAGKNPDVPPWIADDYFQAISRLAEIGSMEVLKAQEVDDVRAILSVIAIEKGLRTHGRFLVNYSEDELMEIESRSEWSA